MVETEQAVQAATAEESVAPEAQQEEPDAQVQQEAACISEEAAAALPGGMDAFAAAQAQASAIAAKLLEGKRKLDDGEDGPDLKRAHAEFNGAGLTTLTGDTVFTMYAPADKVGRIIGRAGVTIRELEQRTGARVQVDHKVEGDLKPVHISGPVVSVDAAKKQIADLLESDQTAHAGPTPGEPSRTLECPPGIVGRIIGRGGETIRSLQTASGAHILVDQNFPADQNRVITISGRQEAVDRANKMIMDLINGDPGSAQQVIQKVLGSYGVGVTRVLECPKAVVGRVIGKGGETIKTLQKQYGVSIQIDQSGNPCKITVAGPQQSSSACERAVMDIIEDRPQASGAAGGGYAGFGMPVPAYGAGYGQPQFGATPGYGAPAGYGMPAFGGFGAPAGYGAPSSAAFAAPAYGAPQSGYGVQPGYGVPATADPYAATGSYGAPQQHQQQAPSHGLPGPWQELRDDQGRTYYYNSVTGSSQWERPT